MTQLYGSDRRLTVGDRNSLRMIFEDEREILSNHKKREQRMFCRKKLDEQSQISKDIDDWLQEEQKNRVYNILLLGTGESGKTTFIKQMKIIHINGYDRKDKLDHVPYIRSNLQESIHDIVFNMRKLLPKVTFDVTDEDIYLKASQYIIDFGTPKSIDDNDNDKHLQLPEEYYENVKLLWNNDKIQETYRRSNEYQLIDCAAYMLNRLDAIKENDYVPTVDDILYCRKKTVQISKISFEVKNVKFSVTDVGGQRGERKKWIQAFCGVDVVLFLVASSDYDQRLREDNTTNRLEEAFVLFSEICSNSYLSDSGLIVFLNKQDLLKKKIEDGRSKLENYFSEYKEFKQQSKEKTEYEKAKTFMKDKIMQISHPKNLKVSILPGRVENQLFDREPYVHFTIAIDTENIKLVFNDVKDIILKWNLSKIF